MLLYNSPGVAEVFVHVLFWILIDLHVNTVQAFRLDCQTCRLGILRDRLPLVYLLVDRLSHALALDEFPPRLTHQTVVLGDAEGLRHRLLSCVFKQALQDGALLVSEGLVEPVVLLFSVQ